MANLENNPKKWKWTRVNSGNSYQYVRTGEDNRIINDDFDFNTGKFKIYNLPNESSFSSFGSLNQTKFSPRTGKYLIDDVDVVYNPKEKKRDYSYTANSAYHPEDVAKVMELPFLAFGRGLSYTLGEDNAQKVGMGLSYLMPSRYIGWARSGYMPHDYRNPGIENERPEERGLNLLSDLILVPSAGKMVKGTGEIAGEMLSKTKPYKAWQISRAIDNMGLPNLEIKPEIKFNEITEEFGKVTTMLPRLISLNTYPLYRGPLFSIKSIVNPNGTVNPRQAMKVLHTVADWFGNKAYRMESRLENPEWHKTDPTTFHHTKLVAKSAWNLPIPLGFTKYDQMVAALGHDFGKIVSGDGHAQIGADLAKLVFPDLTEALYRAIAEHMGIPKTDLGKVTKAADIDNGALTSLRFFERPSKISEAERLGIPKGERNFTPRWHVANYPGYQLKILMKGSPLERQLSRNGTININSLMGLVNKTSEIEKSVINKVLEEKFAGLKTIDYNLFKKAVLDELINYSTKPQMKYSTYGMDRLGFNIIKEPNNNGGIIEYLPRVRTNTFTFESPRIPVGNNKHYDTTTLGHSRTYITQDEPNILHVMESLSDWGQSHVKMMPSVLAHQIAIEKALKSGNVNAFHSFTNRLSSLMRDKLTKYERIALENINKEIESGLLSGFYTIEDLWNKKYEILKKAGNRSNIGVLGLHLHDNYLQRQLQENLRYAAENGLTKMRYPTSETAAKIEGYLKVNHTLLNELSNLQMKLGELFENGEISWEEYDKMIDAINKLKKELFGKEYDPKHQTILKKYVDFPKLFLKLFKDQKVRTVTDAKGNTWYEVDVPKGYLSREWLFKQGGKMKKWLINNKTDYRKRGGNIIKKFKESYEKK